MSRPIKTFHHWSRKKDQGQPRNSEDQESAVATALSLFDRGHAVDGPRDRLRGLQADSYVPQNTQRRQLRTCLVY